MKEKTQLKERSPSQQEQSIKETNTIGLQFNYLIPSMGKSIIVCVSDCVIQLTDNLDCLSDVQVAEKKLFLVQGRKPQLMNWEQFGLRIDIEEDSLLSSETVEVATAALVGGQFKFPKNTVLVSAVYAVSVSESLLKPLRLEMQHCVDLRGRPGLSQYLKFAIAQVSTPSLPYQFSLVEGGEFTSNSWYGAINRKDFCLVCILGWEMKITHVLETDQLKEEEEVHNQCSNNKLRQISNKCKSNSSSNQEKYLRSHSSNQEKYPRSHSSNQEKYPRSHSSNQEKYPRSHSSNQEKSKDRRYREISRTMSMENNLIAELLLSLNLVSLIHKMTA